jgi:hypothetical protein
MAAATGVYSVFIVSITFTPSLNWERPDGPDRKGEYDEEEISLRLTTTIITRYTTFTWLPR